MNNTKNKLSRSTTFKNEGVLEKFSTPREAMPIKSRTLKASTSLILKGNFEFAILRFTTAIDSSTFQ